MDKQFQLGSISTGTLRTEDLLEAFANECDYYGIAYPLVTEARTMLETDPENDDLPEIVNELADALQEVCPSYVYFGAHPDDGADFGFWPDIDALEDAVRYGECIKVDDLVDIPSDYDGDVMLVNDHGNVTFGTFADGDFQEVWSCV